MIDYKVTQEEKATNQIKEQTEVLASARQNYTVEITQSIDFGIIDKKEDIKTRDLEIKIIDTILDKNSAISVKLRDEDIFMWDKAEENNLRVKVEEQEFIFETEDQSKLTQVSIDPSQLTAVGSYSGVLNFEISYLEEKPKEQIPSPVEWFDFKSISGDYQINGFVSPLPQDLIELSNKGPIELVIPEINLNENIVMIGNGAFRNDINPSGIEINKVFIPDTVLEIDTSAFIDQPITELSGGKNLNIIGSMAFKNCELEYIYLKKNLFSIGIQAFYSNPIKVIELPQGINDIGANAFNQSKLDFEKRILRYDGPLRKNAKDWIQIRNYIFNNYSVESNR